MILFASLGIYAKLGGEQRYAATLVDAIAQIAPGARVLALWDGAADAARAPRGIAFAPCARSKARFLLGFAAALASARPNTVILGHVSLAPLALVARVLRPRARVLVVAYGLEVWDEPSRLRGAVLRRLVHRVVSISRFTADAMAKAYRLDRARFELLPPAVAPPADPVARVASLAPTILSVSRLGAHAAQKGIDVVLEALPRVARAVPGVRYEIVGDGEGRAMLETRARELGLAEIVRFRGALPDDELEAAYASADVFVLPSAQEGFGIVYLEAWRHGLAVVAADAAAATEVVGPHGMLVPPADAGALAEALVELLLDRSHRHALGEEGRAAVRARYSRETFFDAFEGIVRRAGEPSEQRLCGASTQGTAR